MTPSPYDFRPARESDYAPDIELTFPDPEAARLQRIAFDLESDNRSLRRLLASLEWSGNRMGAPACPSCLGIDPRNRGFGHSENCALVSAIAGKGAE